MYWGRGYRWMFWLTGMPGWIRAWYSAVQLSTQATSFPSSSWIPFWFCRRFLWLYGWVNPVSIGASQPKMTKEQEVQMLEKGIKALEEELEYLKNTLAELKGQK